MQTKNERFLRIVEHFSDGNKAHFAKLVGESPQTISGWAKRDIGLNVIKKIANKVPINPTWLFSGEGQMLKGESLQFADDASNAPVLIDYTPEDKRSVMEVKIAEDVAKEVGVELIEVKLENRRLREMLATVNAELSTALAELTTLRGVKSGSQFSVKSSDVLAEVPADTTSSVVKLT